MLFRIPLCARQLLSQVNSTLGTDPGGTPQICTSSAVQSEMGAAHKGDGNVSLENPLSGDYSPSMWAVVLLQ